MCRLFFINFGKFGAIISLNILSPPPPSPPWTSIMCYVDILDGVPRISEALFILLHFSFCS